MVSLAFIRTPWEPLYEYDIIMYGPMREMQMTVENEEEGLRLNHASLMLSHRRDPADQRKRFEGVKNGRVWILRTRLV